ncbi:MAG TPA: hypothetical protein VJ860_16330 [Polyangia bacterium]|jgi:hypothetical protein|nr:hypothetical protein [Polyangia bacterium]
MISTKNVLKVVVLLAALAPASTSSAQYAYFPIVPTVHPALELDGSRIGSWAEYRATDGTFTSKQRLALVGQGPKGYLLEVRIESPLFQEPVLVRFELPAGSVKAAPQPWIDVMIGQRPPMRIFTPLPSPFPEFLDPKALVGKERISAAGRAFTTKHYRNGKGGDIFEYWVSREAPPLGFVRSVKKVGSTVSGMELLSVGEGARPEMTQVPHQVDQAEFGRELEQNMRKR